MERHARAKVTPVRQRTQYSCMAASLMMSLNALGHTLTEDEVNRVMGAEPMRGASWDQMLASAQYFGCRATLTTPSTIQQLKSWTDAGVPVVIAWNPEGRPWSHASVVFHVDDDRNVHIADPNIPNPEKTVRIVSEDDFYAKWFESSEYLVRRPACAIEREISAEGKAIQASRRIKMSRLDDYDPIPGMEGPFNYKGRILYYDPRYKGGSYYDRDQDVYLDHDEAVRIMNRQASIRQVGEWVAAFERRGIYIPPTVLKGMEEVAAGATPGVKPVEALKQWLDANYTPGVRLKERQYPGLFALADFLNLNLQHLMDGLDGLGAPVSEPPDLQSKWMRQIEPFIRRFKADERAILDELSILAHFAEKEGIQDVDDAIDAWLERLVLTNQEISRRKRPGLFELARLKNLDLLERVQEIQVGPARMAMHNVNPKTKRKPGVVQLPKQRDPNAEALAGQRNRGDGAHQNRSKDVERGRSRKEKHRTDWRDKEASGATLEQNRQKFTANQAFVDLVKTRYGGHDHQGQTIVPAGQYTIIFTPDRKGTYTVEGAPAAVLIKAAQYLRATFSQVM